MKVKHIFTEAKDFDRWFSDQGKHKKFNADAEKKPVSSVKSNQRIAASAGVEKLLDFAQDNLSDDEYEELDGQLAGLHIEDHEDHEEAETIIVRFLNERDFIKG